jgi:hypothetical protein
MPTPTDVQSAEQAARRLLDTRRDEKIVSIRELAVARQAKLDAAAAADEADRADAASWAKALRNGWTETDLREVGYEPPTRRAPGRPRRRAASAPRAQTAVQDDASHDSPTAAATGGIEGRSSSDAVPEMQHS